MILPLGLALTVSNAQPHGVAHCDADGDGVARRHHVAGAQHGRLAAAHGQRLALAKRLAHRLQLCRRQNSV